MRVQMCDPVCVQEFACVVVTLVCICKQFVCRLYCAELLLSFSAKRNTSI